MIDLLQGLRIIDLTTIVLGPYATRFLGDFGADVIKVEPPEGDLFRSADVARSPGMGAAFMNCNRNKRSITLNLKNPAGQRVLHRLIGTADVLVHNMRHRSAVSLGIDYASVRRINNAIVYCHASGFGRGGRMEDVPAYDDTVQALSGLSFINADESGRPRYLPTVLCDKVGGLHFAIAILAGIAARERTGHGTCIEAPMFESMVSFLLAEHLAGETFDPPLCGVGYGRLSAPFRKPFRSKDGYVSIIPYNTGHWRRFVDLIGRADLVESELICNPAERNRNINSLYELVASVAPTRTTAEWIDLLGAHDIPCAIVNRLEDILSNPHLSDVEMFEFCDHPTEKRIRTVRTPFRIDAARQAPDAPAPNLGENSAAILQEAGFSETEVEDAMHSGALGRAGRGSVKTS